MDLFFYFWHSACVLWHAAYFVQISSLAFPRSRVCMMPPLPPSSSSLLPYVRAYIDCSIHIQSSSLLLRSSCWASSWTFFIIVVSEMYFVSSLVRRRWGKHHTTHHIPKTATKISPHHRLERKRMASLHRTVHSHAIMAPPFCSVLFSVKLAVRTFFSNYINKIVRQWNKTERM